MTTLTHDTRTERIIASREGFKRFGQKMLGNSFSADDIAQETAMRVWIHRHRLGKDGDVVPYGYRTAWNLTHDLQRKSKRIAPGGLDSCDPKYMRREDSDPIQAALCRTALACLDERQFTIVRLFYWEGWTTAEIGAHLGMSEGLVQVTLHRARKKMKDRLS